MADPTGSTTSSTIHRYRRGALVGDYLRGGAGFLITATPLVMATPGFVVSAVLFVLAAAFFWYLARTLHRTVNPVCCDDRAIRRGRTRIEWSKLRRFRLRRFGGGKNPGSGLMELKLGAPGASLTIDSELEGFLGIVRRAAQAAERNGVHLDRRTQGWLSALGHDLRRPPAGG